MTLVLAELLKVRTTGLWRGLALLLLPLWAMALVYNWSNAGMASPDDTVGVTVELVTSGQFFGILVVLLLSAIMVTSEFFHLTATTTFLVTPRRERVILAKFAAAVLISVVVWALVTALNLIVLPAVLDDLERPVDLGTAEVWQAAGLNALAFALWAVLGVGCGVLIRSQLAATLILAILYMLGPPVATGVFFMIGDYVDGFENLDFVVPTVASDLMITGQDLPEGPGRLTGTAVLLAYAVVTGVLGTLIAKRRDVG